MKHKSLGTSDYTGGDTHKTFFFKKHKSVNPEVHTSLTYEQFTNEALNKDEWLNYKDDTYLTLEKPKPDTSQVAQIIKRLLETEDVSEILFTGSDIGFGEDFKYFYLHIIPKAQTLKSDVIQFDDYTVYFMHYIYQDMPFVTIDIKDTYEYSYVFIKEEHYEKFNETF